MQRIRTNRWGRIIAESIPILLFVIFIVLDQVTKNYFHKLWEKQGDTTVIDGFFCFTYTLNTGAAWSFLADVSWGQTFFKILTCVALVLFVCFYIYAFKNKYTWLKYSLSFVGGGTVGNFIDRLLSNAVTDFLSFVFGNYHFPLFNLADTFLVVGVIMVMVHFLFLDDGALFGKKHADKEVSSN